MGYDDFDSHKRDRFAIELERMWFDEQSKMFNFNPPDTLYHYTSAAGLSGIVSQNGMYSSPAFSMNDPKELIYGLEVIEETCMEILKGSATNIEKQVALSLQQNPIVISKDYTSMFGVLMLISFSEKEDNLSQWRCYADDGRGFSIGINTSKIHLDNHQKDEGLFSLIGKWRFVKCVYDKSKQKKIVKTFIKIFSNKLSNHNTFLANPTLLGIYALAYLWDLCSTFKHKAYEDECEWRVRSILDPKKPSDKSQLSSYISAGFLKSSKLVNFANHNPISSITIGPRNIFDIASLAVDVMLHKHVQKGVFSNVKIKMSDAPYR